MRRFQISVKNVLPNRPRVPDPPGVPETPEVKGTDIGVETVRRGQKRLSSGGEKKTGQREGRGRLEVR